MKHQFSPLLFMTVSLLLIGLAWCYYSFALNARVNMVMRRELQAFEAHQLQVIEIIQPQWPDDLRDRFIFANPNGRDELRTRNGETFDTMRRTLSNRLRLPIWPGLVAVAVSCTFLLYWILDAVSTRIAARKSPPQ